MTKRPHLHNSLRAFSFRPKRREKEYQSAAASRNSRNRLQFAAIRRTLMRKA
jgi:hypothetical protein